MDFILSQISRQAMSYAIRSGITITSGYAFSQCSRLVKTTTGEDHDQLGRLQRRLESKVRIISPAIDMIELIAARGNSSLESAVSLTKSIRQEIQHLGVQISKAAADEELLQRGSSQAKSRAESDAQVKSIIRDIKDLLERIEDAVPLINLAITTSGANLSTTLPPSISPSRLLQASTFLSAGDSQYAANLSRPAQIGPAFTLSMYMLFLGHADRTQDIESLQKTIWKEVIHKARVKLLRVPLSECEQFQFHTGKYSESDGEGSSSHSSANLSALDFAYQLSVIEDLDDDRVHTFEDEGLQPSTIDDVTTAGIREAIPIHQVSKIFYADTGKILNIGSDDETNNPILLLKRDPAASPPQQMEDNLNLPSEFGHEPHSKEKGAPRSGDTGDTAQDEDREVQAQFAREDLPAPQVPKKESRSPSQWKLPGDLDPEWIAFEVYSDTTSSDDESDNVQTEPERPSRRPVVPRRESLEPHFTSSLSKLNLSSPMSTPQSQQQSSKKLMPKPHCLPPLSASPVSVQTSLSLLEMLIRLTSLQQFQQTSHLAITDELLNFFLQESATTGTSPGDAEARKRIRYETRQRVGFDPYDESPIKRYGEDRRRQKETALHTSWDDIPLPTSSPIRGETPEPASPLLLRSREHATRSNSRTPDRGTPSKSSPAMSTSPPSSKVNAGPVGPATPPETTKSRRNLLKEEGVKRKGSAQGRSSPLGKWSPQSPS